MDDSCLLSFLPANQSLKDRAHEAQHSLRASDVSSFFEYTHPKSDNITQS